MGALHAGHAGLMRAARAENDLVAVSIFVNPTQFGPGEDLERYPRTLDFDLDFCRREGVDWVFAPAAPAMYPPRFHTFVEVERLQEGLCGRSRPGHFRGVATVVLKLFHLVQPDRAYFGQKDAQQARLIEQMVRDLDVPVKVRRCPIEREADGLALSSRNRYLDANQRRQATALYRALSQARRRIVEGERDARQVRDAILKVLESARDAQPDYVEVVDAHTLEPVARMEGDILIAVAVRFGATRLIDNLQIDGIRAAGAGERSR
jgi:pantoate--beta-alanine ligase